MSPTSMKHSGAVASTERGRILVVYPQGDMGQLIKSWLADEGHCVEVARNKSEAIAALAVPPDVIIIDVSLSQRSEAYEDLRNVRLLCSDGLLPLNEASDLLGQLLQKRRMVEERKDGVELARELLRRIGNTPVIFTSAFREELCGLPFGETFYLVGDWDRLLELVARLMPHDEQPIILEFPVTTVQMRVAA